MQKFLYLFLCILLIAATAKDDFVSIKVNDNIAVSLPQDFVPLPQEQINSRQLSARKPLLFYTDANNEVDFTVNMSYSLWGRDDFEIMRSFYRSTLMSLYDEVHFITDDVVEINGRKFVMFEFESAVRDDEESFVLKGDIRKYTLIIYTVLENNNTVLISFTVPAIRKETWQETARQIMAKVKVKD